MAIEDYVWRHQDSRTWDFAIPLAVARARTMQWGTTDKDVADLRALLVATAWMFNDLSTNPAIPNQDGSSILIAPRGKEEFSSDERRTAAQSILRSWTLIAARARARGMGGLETIQKKCTTVDGQPVTVPSGNNAGWIIAVAAIVVGGIALTYIAQKAAEVLDRAFKREEDTRKLVSAQSAALEVLKTHREDEKVRGREVPFSEVERKTLDALVNLQRTYSGPEVPLDSAFPKASSASSGGLFLALGALGAVWLMSRRG